jgi:signal transduction histidine kinase
MATAIATPAQDHDRDEAQHELNMFSLTFKNKKVERSYLHDNMTMALPLVRLSLFFAMLLYGFFGILDYYVLPHSYTDIFLIRFGFVCPGLFAVFLTTFIPKFFFRFAQPLLSFSMVTSGFGVIAMTIYAPPPANALYYAGLIMVVIYGSTLVRMRFIFSAIITAMLMAAYQFVALDINPVLQKTYISNNFFLIMASLVGIFSSYIQELYIRRNWISTQLLTREKERSEALLAESQAANHAKSEFLAIVSHELRTPLNAIIGFSEFLKMEMFGPLGSERYKSYAKDIYISGQHLLEIINDILDLSRAEANKLEISEDVFNLEGTIDTCMRMFLNKAAEEGVRLTWNNDVTALLHADKRLFTQVLINLISNAIKFTGRGGQIEVAMKEGPDGACQLSISDSGIGIAPEDITKVIEPFVQVESATSRHHDGLGLGLPLVNRIMKLHGGELIINSAIGKGTVVTAIFPPHRVSDWHVSTSLPAAMGATG